MFFNIVDSDEINGSAWCNDKEDHVEINKGVIRTFYDLFLELLMTERNCWGFLFGDLFYCMNSDIFLTGIAVI